MFCRSQARSGDRMIRKLILLTMLSMIVQTAMMSQTLKLRSADFSFWNPKTGGWFVEKGKFVIHVGSSSADIRLKKEIELF